MVIFCSSIVYKYGILIDIMVRISGRISERNTGIIKNGNYHPSFHHLRGYESYITYNNGVFLPRNGDLTELYTVMVYVVSINIMPNGLTNNGIFHGN